MANFLSWLNISRMFAISIGDFSFALTQKEVWSLHGKGCISLSSALWLRYSVFIEDLKLILLQSYAVLMQSFYLLAMLYYRSKKVGWLCVSLPLIKVEINPQITHSLSSPASKPRTLLGRRN